VVEWFLYSLNIGGAHMNSFYKISLKIIMLNLILVLGISFGFSIYSTGFNLSNALSKETDNQFEIIGGSAFDDTRDEEEKLSRTEKLVLGPIQTFITKTLLAAFQWIMWLLSVIVNFSMSILGSNGTLALFTPYINYVMRFSYIILALRAILEIVRVVILRISQGSLREIIQKTIINVVILSLTFNIVGMIITVMNVLTKDILGINPIMNQLKEEGGLITDLTLKISQDAGAIIDKLSAQGIIVLIVWKFIFAIVGVYILYQICAILVATLQIIGRQLELMILAILFPFVVSVNMGASSEAFDGWKKLVKEIILGQGMQIIFMNMAITFFLLSFIKMELVPIAVIVTYFMIKAPKFVSRITGEVSPGIGMIDMATNRAINKFLK
jgi:hypothetical protein